MLVWMEARTGEYLQLPGSGTYQTVGKSWGCNTKPAHSSSPAFLVCLDSHIKCTWYVLHMLDLSAEDSVTGTINKLIMPTYFTTGDWKLHWLSLILAQTTSHVSLYNHLTFYKQPIPQTSFIHSICDRKIQANNLAESVHLFYST